MMFTPRQKGIGKDNFIKLQDRESVIGVFVGEIFTFKRHWINDRGEICQGGKEKCQFCKDDPKTYPSFRFRVNFINDTMCAKIFEGGGEAHDALCLLDKKYDLSKTLVEIIRKGKGTRTTYDFEILTDQKVPTDISKVSLLSLS